MRELSKSFMNDLLNPDGLLHPILERVKQDQTLMLAIRENYINIYYRGGNILRIKEQSANSYRLKFDTNYNISGQRISSLPGAIKTQDEAKIWVDSFATLKNIMDVYFSVHSKPEREFQQLLARENNDSTISNQSEYFISDIEFTDSGIGARFDILAIRWLASQRKSGTNCRAVLIEMKYGDGALGGNAGLLKHLKDIDTLIANIKDYDGLLRTMENQFKQLNQLGLLNFNKGKSKTTVKLDVKNKPEVVFILVNHNPRSLKLKKILSNPAFDAHSQSKRFDLRFYVASFTGYGLHADCMFDLAEFRKLL